jgi:hypothetical protein
MPAPGPRPPSVPRVTPSYVKDLRIGGAPVTEGERGLPSKLHVLGTSMVGLAEGIKSGLRFGVWGAMRPSEPRLRRMKGIMDVRESTICLNRLDLLCPPGRDDGADAASTGRCLGVDGAVVVTGCGFV